MHYIFEIGAAESKVSLFLGTENPKVRIMFCFMLTPSVSTAALAARGQQRRSRAEGALPCPAYFAYVANFAFAYCHNWGFDVDKDDPQALKSDWKGHGCSF